MEEFNTINLINLDETIAKNIFFFFINPWEVLPKIKDFIIELGNSLDSEKYIKQGEKIWIAKTAKIIPTAYIFGPCIIDEEAEIRHCAYIRENAIIGRKATVGNSTEIKNSILFNNILFSLCHYSKISSK